MLVFTDYMSKEEQNRWERQRFPVKLHRLLQILDNPKAASMEGLDVDKIGGWNPDGKSFQIYNTEHFVVDCLPSIFHQTKYKSYQRQLCIYGFTRIKSPMSSPYKGSYYHPMFTRTTPTKVIAQMERKKQASERSSHDMIQERRNTATMLQHCHNSMAMIKKKTATKQNEKKTDKEENEENERKGSNNQQDKK